MSNNNYEIKVEGTENKFGEAIRYNKQKGRFDLIPMDVFLRVVRVAQTLTGKFSATGLYRNITEHDNITAIICIACMKYNKSNTPVTPTMHFDLTIPEVYECILKMMGDLAIHYQKGAEKYGERNCEKGIPLWSFYDSAIRHTFQFLLGETDEPHHIAAIWNFWMAEWTIKNHPERCGDDWAKKMLDDLATQRKEHKKKLYKTKIEPKSSVTPEEYKENLDKKQREVLSNYMINTIPAESFIKQSFDSIKKKEESETDIELMKGFANMLMDIMKDLGESLEINEAKQEKCETKPNKHIIGTIRSFNKN